MSDLDRDDWCDHCFTMDPELRRLRARVKELEGELVEERSQVAKFRSLLAMMNKAYRSLYLRYKDLRDG